MGCIGGGEGSIPLSAFPDALPKVGVRESARSGYRRLRHCIIFTSICSHCACWHAHVQSL